MGKTGFQFSPDGGTTKYDLRDSNIAPIELDSAHASQPYAVNEEFVLDSDGNLYTATSPISQGSAIIVYPTSGYNCKLSDSVTGQIKAVKDGLGTASAKNSTSVVTDSTDLVESGAVKDIVGWGNKNLLYDAKTYVFDKAGEIGTRIHSFHLSKLPKIGDKLKVVNLSHNSKDVLFVRIGSSTAYSKALYFDVSASGQQIIELEVISEIPSLVNATIYIGIKTGEGWTASLTVNDLMAYDANIIDSTYEPPHASVEESKCDNSVIGTVEGANASKAWSIGEHFISGGQFKEVTQPIASGGAISDSNTVDKPIADIISSPRISLDSTVKYAHKYGKIVICKIRFTVSSDITGSNYKLFRLPFGAQDNMLIPLYNRAAPFNIITTLSTYISSLGDVYITGTLEAGQYDLCGAYFEV